jgi:hypothetical protein
MRKKMTIIASITIDNENELKLDKQKWDKLKILIWMKLTNSMNP